MHVDTLYETYLVSDFCLVPDLKGPTPTYVVSILQLCNIANLCSTNQIMFNFVNLKIRMNRHIMKLDDKNIICVGVLVFYDYSVLSEL